MKRTSELDGIEFDVEEVVARSGYIDEYIFLQDLKERKLFLNTEISQDTVYGIVRNIMQYNAEDKGIPVEERKPITLYVVTNGGEVDAGFELIDAIRSSKTPVRTVNLGYCYSMGFLIFLAGHKRYAQKNAKFLHHDGMSVIMNSGTKVKDQMEFQDKVEDRVKHFVLERTNIDEKEYRKRVRTEWYMFSDEAKQYGVTDYIIGDDCDIDEVI